jgi:putative methionine-R-sulfoxide reductase with GAF domain
MGSRVTGWSAATRRVSINATASLDLANVADFFDPPLQSVLCIPVACDSEVLGVLTAYSPDKSAFNETHTYAFEQIAIALSDRLRSLSVVDPSRQLVFRPRIR